LYNNPHIGDSDVIEAPGSFQAEISRVAVRLPPFWTERPAAGFAQAEAQFHLAGISKKLTKFYHDLSAGPTMRHRSGGHYQFSTATGSLHHFEN
jgi:hypothetical protein